MSTKELNVIILKMAIPISKFKLSHWPWGLIIALCLSIVFEIFNASYDNYFYSDRVQGEFDGLRMKIKNSISQKTSNSFDIITLGDCYYILGVKPSIIQDKTGRSCFNFATHRGQTILGSYLLFRNYIKTCEIKPKYLLLGFLNTTLNAKKDPLYLYDFRKGNIDILSKEFSIIQTIKFLLPSVAHQHFYKYVLIGNGALPNVRDINEYIQKVYQDGGYYPTDKKNCHYSDQQIDEGYDADLDLNVSNFADTYLNKILDLASENNMKAIYIFPTHPEDSFILHKKYGSIDKHRDYMRNLKNKYPNLSLIDVQFLLNEKIYYLDREHLNPEGTNILSAYLGDYLLTMESKQIRK